MTFKEAKKEYFKELEITYGNVKNAIKVLGKTTIRCGWVDYVDYLIKSHLVREKIAYKWGQVL